MDLNSFLSAFFGIAVAVGGFFFRRIQSTMDDLARRLTHTEIKLARQEEQTSNLITRLDRIEEKIDKLLEE